MYSLVCACNICCTLWTFCGHPQLPPLPHPKVTLTVVLLQVGLAFHFAVEQRARSFLGQFFNFNGTAGVWRIKAINDAGGWESDTVVEDMDLSLRVYLKGWRSIYLHDVCCPNELPSTLSAYKTQQFRWLSGPMQIVRKSFANIFFSR